MKPRHTFRVLPSLPESLKALQRIAFNLRWAWNHDTIELFRRLDNDLWEESYHNPVLMLGTIDQSILESAARDAGFRAHLERVSEEFDQYAAAESSWYNQTHGDRGTLLAAYFSAEFGLTECLSIFAGGLGVLSGDHLKSASDLGVPLVGVGLLYQQGYFKQYLNEAGWQQEAYEDNDFYNLPVIREKQADGSPLTIDIALPNREVKAQIWKAQVGRVPLYLLDSNIPSNSPEDQRITHQLYGGDQEMRIQQELLLGMGGLRALEALGLEPAVYHLNEGHSAFLAIECTRRLMETRNLTFAQACEAAAARLIFTTHTPVAAGHDYFSPELIDRYFSGYYQLLGISRKAFLALGRKDPNNSGEPFCMTVLALRMSTYSNGVSRLHGRVSRRMWKDLFPGVPEHEIPISSITNGVHFQTWIYQEMKQLYDRYFGPRWREEPADQKIWRQAEHISAEELWRTHERRRERLVGLARKRLRIQLERRGAPPLEIKAAEDVLDSEALTLGFARRFASYKRATLLLHDQERLARILTNPEKPVQIIFAGKAHPRDDHGKNLIQRIVALAREERFRRRLVFIENYDMAVARYLLQGVDVWVNTPMRPSEASGTSGMKAAASAVLNLSILDGWWDEAYSPQVGWAIGRGETYADSQYQDQVESEALYDILEKDVIPTFFDRDANGIPRGWVARMRASIGSLCHYFNSNRMVGEYTDLYYLPAAERSRRLTENQMARSIQLAAWKTAVQKNWAQVRVENIETHTPQEIEVGGKIETRAMVNLGNLAPTDVKVELYMGRVDARGDFFEAESFPMDFVRQEDKGRCLYELKGVTYKKSGLHGYTVRILPHHPDLVTAFLPGLIAWA